MNKLFNLLFLSVFLLSVFLLSVFFLSVFFGSLNQSLAEEKITVLVPRLGPQSLASNIDLSVTDPYRLVVHSAVAPSLLVASDEKLLSDELFFRFVSRFEQSADRNTMRVWLRDDISFVNGARPKAVDVQSSLQECQRQNPHRFDSIRISMEGVSSLVGDRRAAQSSDEHFLFQGDASELKLFLASCPITLEETRLIFGRAHGRTNLFVGLGPYAITEVRPGIRTTLQMSRAMKRLGKSHGLVNEIEVREVNQIKNALTAIRHGTADLVFVPQENDEAEKVVELAKKDQTLLVTTCQSQKLIYRNGLNVDCNRRDWVARLQYTG